MPCCLWFVEDLVRTFGLTSFEDDGTLFELRCLVSGYFWYIECGEEAMLLPLLRRSVAAAVAANRRDSATWVRK